jgi:hypothetical protein
LKLRSNEVDLFPTINPAIIRLSPSQRFQFACYAECTRREEGYSDNARNLYNHDVVRYLHSLLLSRNSIIDISVLPLRFLGPRLSKDYLLAIFESLRLLRFASGVCLSHVKRTNVIREFVPVVACCKNLQIIHFEDYGAKPGRQRIDGSPFTFCIGI